MRVEFHFLVIDDNADSRMLLVKTLMRKFPSAIVSECQQGDAAVKIAQTEKLNGIVAHRTYDYDGESLIALLRKANPSVPIVMVSGHDRSAKALAAGADAFLHYDRWLEIGTVLTEVLARRSGQGSAAGGSANVFGLAAEGNSTC